MPKKKTKDEFVADARKVHGDRYGYDEGEYLGNDRKIKIRCFEHGIFEQTPHSHLGDTGCPKCRTADLRKRFAKKQDIFVLQSNVIHNKKYDYRLVNYINNKTKVEIICPVHNSFWQTPKMHLIGQGCPKCSNNTLKSLDEFEINAKLIHGPKYDYSHGIYKGNKVKIEIICRKHGSFWQLPNSHLSDGKGCSRCSFVISKPETQWLDYLGIPDDIDHRQIKIKVENKTYKVDGFLPPNTIYEFHGDFWHGNSKRYKSNGINPKMNKTNKELYNETIKRENALKKAGYKVVSIWESEFKDVQRFFKQLAKLFEFSR